MKKLIIIPLFFFSLSVFGQFTKPQLYQGINLNIRNKGASQLRLADMLDSIVVSMGTGNLTGAVTSSGLATSLGSFTSNALGTAISDPVRTVTGTDAIVQADNGRTIYFNSATPFNFTIDALTINTFTMFRNIGIGTVNFVDGSGVTSTGATALLADEVGGVEYIASTTPIISKAGSGGIISDGGDATNADFTASVNTVYNLPAATLSTNRTITIPAGSDMDVIEIYNEEAGFTWNLTGSTVYLSDGTTAVTSLLAQTNYVIRKVSGKWKIKN